jgi:hypothetical protein
MLLVAPAFADDYSGRVLSVEDGDSFIVEITSFNVEQRGECKMLHYNAPELNERVGSGVPDGRASAQKLTGLIDQKKVQIKTRWTQSFSKNLCDVWLMDGTHVNSVMRDYLSSYSGRDKYLHLENR